MIKDDSRWTSAIICLLFRSTLGPLWPGLCLATRCYQMLQVGTACGRKGWDVPYFSDLKGESSAEKVECPVMITYSAFAQLPQLQHCQKDQGFTRVFDMFDSQIMFHNFPTPLTYLTYTFDRKGVVLVFERPQWHRLGEDLLCSLRHMRVIDQPLIQTKGWFFRFGRQQLRSLIVKSKKHRVLTTLKASVLREVFFSHWHWHILTTCCLCMSMPMPCNSNHPKLWSIGLYAMFLSLRFPCQHFQRFPSLQQTKAMLIQIPIIRAPTIFHEGFLVTQPCQHAKEGRRHLVATAAVSGQLPSMS